VHRSTLEASLKSCRHFTNRDEDGAVRAGAPTGDWLGAIGYLTLLDQIGGSVERMNPPRTPSGRSLVERAIADFCIGVSDEEAICLYALRNSLAHNFSLVNYPVGVNISENTRQKMTRLFTLTQGTSQLIEWPKIKWNPRRPNSGGATIVDLQRVGDCVEEGVKEMRRAYVEGGLRIRRNVTPAVWRNAHFFNHDLRIFAA
jgi:hypothetical protein